MEEKAGPSFGGRIVATLVLAVAAFVLLKIILSFAAAIAGTVLLIVAVIAVIWALRVLL
jgi:hypothetical protein